MHFEFFDPDTPAGITYRFLPHWFQPGATYFVTFRTVDSLPAKVLEEWFTARGQWLIKHGLNPDQPDGVRSLPPEAQAEFHRTFTDGFHKYLDAGYGECLLRRPELADIVASALRHFDGERHHLSDFVVMPNHVHVLFGLIGGSDLHDLGYSWMKYTAIQINKRTGRRGHFWQGESFDHIVRSPEQFEYLGGYIAANPVKARLRDGEFILFQRGKE